MVICWQKNNDKQRIFQQIVSHKPRLLFQSFRKLFVLVETCCVSQSCDLLFSRFYDLVSVSASESCVKADWPRTNSLLLLSMGGLYGTCSVLLIWVASPKKNFNLNVIELAEGKLIDKQQLNDWDYCRLSRNWLDTDGGPYHKDLDVAHGPNSSKDPDPCAKSQVFSCQGDKLASELIGSLAVRTNIV